MITARTHSSTLNLLLLMKQNEVYPECNVDTNLVGYVIGGYAKHKSCCNEVVKAVNGADGFAIGIIDDDKRRATMDAGFKEYELTDEVDGENRHVRLFIHEDGKRYMFTVKPAMDKFIFDATKSLGVDLADNGFATTLDGFKKDAKRIQAATDPKLRKLFSKIIEYPELQRLRNTLKYLMLEQYDAKKETVGSFFDGTLGAEDLQGLFENKVAF